MPIVDQTILITGGSGFLGRRLARALGERNRVVLAAPGGEQLERAERATGCRGMSLDVTEVESARAVVAEVAPDVIVHAAANKFVAEGERDPFSCLAVNVAGSQNVARVAMERGVGRVLGISTDNAAPPTTSTYGLTKALMERLFCSLGCRPSTTRFASVRLGNLAWSTGSVFPAWQAMMTESGAIGSTGPEARRFFLTGDQAAEVVITALEHLDELSGKVLAPRMKAAQIRDVLEVWTRHRGGTWKPIVGGPGRPDHLLIGDLELPYTREIVYGGAPYYVISFNEKAPAPLPRAIGTANAERLSERELVALITPPPEAA